MIESDHLDHKKFRPAPIIIGVLAGKGGVGKSTLTAELAASLIKEGNKVGVLDADIYGPSMRHLLPENVFPKAVEERVVPADSNGISVMSAAYFPSKKGPNGVRAPIANQIITQFIEEVDWGKLDILLIDFPPGTGDIQITLMQKLSFSGAILITKPDQLSLLDVRKSMDMCLQMDLPILGVVENMSCYLDPKTGERHHLFGKNGGKELAEEFGVHFLGEIPVDPGFNQKNLEKISVSTFQKLGKKILETVKVEKGCKINWLDRYHFSIEWLDGKKSVYQFGDVQGICPCIECRLKNQTRAGNVEGIRIEPVGNYAVQFAFSKGCSKGIYPFSYLRRLER